MVRNNVVGNDDIDDSNNIEPFDPCLPNLCFNDCKCVLGLGKSFSCYFIPPYTGNNILIKFND
jgi:hypothetical protein